MRLFRHFLLCLLIVKASFIYSQLADNPEIGIEGLKVPNSPAFVLLDVSPTLVSHPSNGKAFAANILNSVNQNNGIPQNYAVEFSPFWYFKHPGLTAFKYWGIDPKKNVNKGFNQLKYGSISLAYVNSEAADSAGVNNFSNIAIGVRSTVFKIMDKKSRTDLIEANERMVKRLSALNESLAGFDPMDKDYREKVQAFLNGMSEDKELKSCEAEIKEIIGRKPVFAVEFASALNWSFAGNDFSSNQLSLFGAWLTAAYSQSLSTDSKETNKYCNLIALLRYTYDNSLDRNPYTYSSNINLLDIGARLEFEFNQLTVSGEFIYRSAPSESFNTNRASGLVMYSISEKVYLLASFGKNFGNENNLIAQFGLNLGFGTGYEKVVVLK